jgi:hypothetical protein
MDYNGGGVKRESDVGWVGQSEAHHARQFNSPLPVGLTSFDPPYDAKQRLRGAKGDRG